MAVLPATRPRGRIGARNETIAGYLFVAIPMAFFLVLQIGVLFYAAYISLWDWNIRSGPIDFIGLRNFERMLTDPVFHTAIRNSAYYAVVWVPLTMAVGLFLAVIVNQKIRGQTFFRASFYFPAIASSAAITVLWIFLVAPNGLFNEFRAVIGINPVIEFLGYGPRHNWIGDYRTALNSVIILNVWTTSGTFMLFYLASLQSISNEVYEAAAIDGASPWQAFWKITFPLLRPGHFFVATVGVIGALQMFDQARIAGGTDGAPAYALMTIVLYLYNALIQQINPGYAAAVGMVLFAIIMGATLIQRRLFGSAPQW
jgi:multiple sugar transport system permease protein